MLNRDGRFSNPWRDGVEVVVAETPRPERRARNPFFDLIASPPIPDPTPEQLAWAKFDRNVLLLERVKNTEKRKSAERLFQARDKLRELRGS